MVCHIVFQTNFPVRTINPGGSADRFFAIAVRSSKNKAHSPDGYERYLYDRRWFERLGNSLAFGRLASAFAAQQRFDRIEQLAGAKGLNNIGISALLNAPIAVKFFAFGRT